MKKQFIKDLKSKGYNNPLVVYERLDTHSISYEVSLDAEKPSTDWDGHYFVGEVGTANSKDRMLKDWNEFIKKL